MKIVNAEPPLWEKIQAKFQPGSNVIFAFGDVIYNPASIEIPRPLMAHECKHGERQGREVEIWWGEYLTNDNFRYQEEVHGHAAEYLSQLTADREANFKLLSRTAARLIAPLYKYDPQRSFILAMRDINRCVRNS